MTPRIQCAVPFCHRTRKNDDGAVEWICGKHWMAVSSHLRRRKYKLYRRYKARFGDLHFWKFPPGSPQRIAAVKLNRLCLKAWDHCRNQAIERAVGL